MGGVVARETRTPGRHRGGSHIAKAETNMTASHYTDTGESTVDRRRRVVPVVVVVALLAAAFGTVQASRAAFNSTTSNEANSFAAGTVVLGDDDAGGVMFNLSGMTPGSTATKCVNVTYTGSIAANVKLYGSVGGTGLAPYLDVVVDVGTSATGGATFSCTGFASGTNLFTNTLSTFGATHTNHANGLAGFAGATNPTSKSYRFTITLQDANAAQGLTASSTFTWEAQNV